MARILVAEDDADLADVLAWALSLRGGHEVIHAADGLAALEQCRRNQFDFLLLDVAMPHLTGLEVANQIRTEGLHRQAPLVFLTALPPQQYAAAGYAAGADAFLVKPLRLTMLIYTVNELLASRARDRD